MSSTAIFTSNAMACRRAFIADISSTLTAPPPAPPIIVENPREERTVVTGNVVTTKEKVNSVENVPVQKDNISKRVLRALLSECDYFEVMKEETPMVYDNLKDKLKFFQPAFHSTTPEGLNTRLTFLQQCMRPGDTIPVVKGDDSGGKPILEYNNATNTAFGAPPVLVLRVGDFYNTKIIPTSLSLAYENLDINPEGIGIQPMIAKVTMAFNFVGGSGLKESVDKLQNALTFNYYANTEIYDDRADSTDLSYKVIDKDFIQSSALSNVPPPTINDAKPNDALSNESTIGTIITNNISESGQTGNISYETFMDKLVGETQNYFNIVVSKNKEVTTQYNNALRQQWMLERNYTKGVMTVTAGPSNVNLFGKPYNFGKRIDEIFLNLLKEIKSKDEAFLQFISNPSKNFSSRLINQVKENYTNIVNTKKGSYQNALTTIIQTIVGVQQNYVGYLARANTVLYSEPTLPDSVTGGTDGSQQKNGNVRSFILFSTTEVKPIPQVSIDTLSELADDVTKISNNIQEFNGIVSTETSFQFSGINYKGTLVFPVETPYSFPGNEKVFVPFSRNQTYINLSPTSTFQNTTFKMVYMIISDDVVDAKKYETFKTAMIGNILGNTGIIGNGADNLSEVFDAYWDKIAKPLFIEENKITEAFISYMEKEKLEPFLKYTPFPSKKRIFTYTTEGAGGDGQVKLIKSLGATQNQNTNNQTWNDVDDSLFISKVNFN